VHQFPAILGGERRHGSLEITPVVAVHDLMAHSTTATYTYVLGKYSRSYPMQEIQASEWQHFTNPVIRLVLDVNKATQLQSVRLRILWTMDPARDSDQREMVFASPMATMPFFASLLCRRYRKI